MSLLPFNPDATCPKCGAPTTIKRLQQSHQCYCCATEKECDHAPAPEIKA